MITMGLPEDQVSFPTKSSLSSDSQSLFFVTCLLDLSFGIISRQQRCGLEVKEKDIDGLLHPEELHT